MPVDLKVVH